MLAGRTNQTVQDVGKKLAEKTGKAVKKGDKFDKKEKAAKRGAVKEAKGKCFVCGAKKKAKSRFCAEHTTVDAAIKAQAERDGQLEMYQHIMFNVERAKFAMEENAKNNPPGQSFRKACIDWGGFRKAFGIRKSIREIEPEELVDESDFVTMQKAKNVSSPIARKKWKVMLNDKSTEGEGEGADRQIWIQLNKRRNRERERFEEGAYEEGSKKMKAPKQEEAEKLKTFALKNESEWNSGFLSRRQALLPRRLGISWLTFRNKNKRKG